ncbi:phage tail protein [Streptomyces chumphonensis]|uniref:phage tail protein n=1 Tax=Streptomyces chumphonensis TaxID=1214925 RepID=UPI003D705696
MAGPGGREVGRVSIRVLPDTSRFGVSLQRYLDRTEQRVRLNIPIRPDTAQFTARLRAAVTSASNGVVARVRVQVAGQTALNSLHTRLEALDGTQVRVRLEMQGVLDALRNMRRLRRLADELRLVVIRIRVDNTGRALQQLSHIRRRAEAAAVAARRLRGALNGLGRGAGSADSLLSRLGSTLLSVGGSVAKFGTLAAASVPVAAGLSAALAEMGPAAALAAPAVLSLGLAAGAAAVGFRGFGAALKGEDGALDKLTPSARSAVTALRGLRGPLGDIRQVVQERLFKGLSDDISKTARQVLPVFSKGLEGAAGGLNRMFKGVLSTAKEMAKSGALGQALDGAQAGLKNLSQAPALVVQGLSQLGAAAAPVFEQLTKRAGKSMERLSDRMTKAFENGDMQFYIEQAVSAVGDMVDVLKNVAGIVSEIFKAANASGGGFLNTLKEITGAIRDAFADSSVQAGLSALFETLAELARTVGPLLGQALRAVAPVLTALGPPVQRLIAALGDALSPIIKALGPILEEAARAVGKLIDAFLPFLPVISDLLVMALEPLTPVIRKVSEVFVRMAPLISKVAEQFGPMLTPILVALTEAVTQLVTQFGDQLIALLPQLMTAAVELAPVFVQLAESVGEILTELAPLLPQLMSLGTTLVAQVLPAVLPLLPVIAELASIFLHLATGVITVVVIPALQKLIDFITGIRDKMQPFIDAAVAVTEAVVDAFQWLYDTLVGNSIVPDTVREIVEWFAGLPGKAAAALLSLGPQIAGKARDAGARMVTAIREKLSDAVDWIKGMPGRAANALGDLGRTLYSSGRALLSGFIDGIRSRGEDVKNAVGGILSGARNLLPFSPAKEGPFSGRGWTLYSGQSISEALAAGISSRQSLVDSATLRLAGIAHANLAGIRTGAAELRTADQPAVFEGQLMLEGREFMGKVRGVLAARDRQLTAALAAGRR